VPANAHNEMHDTSVGCKHNDSTQWTDSEQLPRGFSTTLGMGDGIIPTDCIYSYQNYSTPAMAGDKPAWSDGYPYQVNETQWKQWFWSYSDGRYIAGGNIMMEKGFKWNVPQFISDYDVAASCEATDVTTQTFDVYDVTRKNTFWRTYPASGATPNGANNSADPDATHFYWNDSVKNYVRLLDLDTYAGREDWGIKAWESRRVKVTINDFSDVGTGFDINVTVENNCQTCQTGNFSVLALIMDMDAVTPEDNVLYINGKTVFPDVSVGWSGINGISTAIQYTGDLAPGESTTLTWSNVGSSGTAHTYKLWCNGGTATVTGVVATPTPSATATATSTGTPSPSATPTTTATATITATATATSTATPTATCTGLCPTATPSSSPTPSPSATPTATATTTATTTATPSPSATPTTTATPTVTPTPTPTATATPTPGVYQNWKYRMHIEINEESGTALTGYQVPITLDTKTFNYNKADASGADIRFTASDVVTPVDYWIETWNTSGESTIWVEVDLGANATETFYMYYGNANASSESNGEATFEFFDHFPGSAVNASKWDVNGSPTVASSILTYGFNSEERVVSKGDCLYGAVRARASVTTWNDACPCGFHYRGDHVGNVTGNAAMWYVYSSSPYMKSWTADGNSIYAQNFTSQPTGFHTYEVTWELGEAQFYIDDTLEKTHTAAVPGASIPVMLGTGSTYQGVIEVDWVLVRQYVGPEPVVNLGEEEATFSWTDYFGGTAGLSTYSLVSVSDGDVITTSDDYDDEFDDASLDAKWAWLNEPGCWDRGGTWDEGNTTAGRIHMISDQDTDFREPFENAHVLYQDISGDFELETVLYGVPSDSIEQSGIGVMQDEDNFFKFGYGDVAFIIHWRGMAVFTEVNATYTNPVAIIDDSSPKYLKLRRTGDQWEAWYHNAGTTVWTHVLTWTQELADPVKLGIAVADGATWPPTNYHTEFDYYRLTRYVTSTDVSLRHQPGWDKFYASHTIPANTSIDYSIIDAGDGSTLCIINAAQAAAGYDLFTCAGSAAPIKLHAELTTTNVSIMPTIHSWNVTRSGPPLYLIPGSEIYSTHNGQIACPADQHHLCVDEFPSQDGGVTIVQTGTFLGFPQTEWLVDRYGPKDFANPYFGTIDSVKLHYWVTSNGAGDALSRGFVRVGNDDYQSPIYYGGSSNIYQEKVFNLTANRSWGWYDFNNIQFGFWTRYPGGFQLSRVTQCYLEIDYTPLDYW
jgi:regulation of enolase protein 1 (concanavalin A-like superfamily)